MILTALLSASLALWLAVWIDRPRKPPRNIEVAELVYSRLLGNRYELQYAAVLFSHAAFFALILTLLRNA